MSKRYDELIESSKSKGETRDCAVRAVSVAARVSYDKAHEILAAKGRRRRKGTPVDITRVAMESLGFNLTEVTGRFQAKTIRTLKREIPSEGTFLVRTSGHILCVQDGEVHDWTNGRVHKILTIEQVTKKGETRPKASIQSRGTRRHEIMNCSVTSILRWMGEDGWDFAEARSVLDFYGCESVSDNTVRKQLRNTNWQPPASLCPDEKEELRRIVGLDE
jgi:hypothetical protein